jgi:hypothetical protein
MAEVKLPLVGGVSKKALVIGGVGSAAVVLLFVIRKKKTAAAAPAATGTSDGSVGNPSDPNSVDPATGLTYGEEASAGSDYLSPGLQDTTQGPTYGATGYYDPNTGQWVYGNTGTGQAAAVTNQQWAQNAIAYLGQAGGVDTGALAAALGAYLAGQPVTTDQESLIDQAIAVEGYPPTSGPAGNPPGIRVSDTGTGAGGTGGSGGGVGGGSGGVNPGGPNSGGTGTGGGTAPAQVSGLHATKVTKNAIGLAWSPSAGATGYQVRVTYQTQVVQTHMTGAASYTVGGLTSGRTYGLHVVAIHGSSWAPEASISQKTK